MSGIPLVAILVCLLEQDTIHKFSFKDNRFIPAVLFKTHDEKGLCLIVPTCKNCHSKILTLFGPIRQQPFEELYL